MTGSICLDIFKGFLYSSVKKLPIVINETLSITIGMLYLLYLVVAWLPFGLFLYSNCK